MTGFETAILTFLSLYFLIHGIELVFLCLLVPRDRKLRIPNVFPCVSSTGIQIVRILFVFRAKAERTHRTLHLLQVLVGYFEKKTNTYTCWVYACV